MFQSTAPMMGRYCFALLAWMLAGSALAEEIRYATDFEKGADDWRPFDARQWEIKKTKAGNVFSQFKKESEYKPPHRSPTNIAILNKFVCGDLEFTGKVRSTIPDYPHRDVCVVFGYQDAAHFYYVHLGKQADDHANQIFIVNGAPRTKISLTSTKGTPWDDHWHSIRVSRKVSDGTIGIYFDDHTNPVMTAKDSTFSWGQVGIGTFDDTCEWDDIKIVGVQVEKK